MITLYNFGFSITHAHDSMWFHRNIIYFFFLMLLLLLHALLLFFAQSTSLASSFYSVTILNCILVFGWGFPQKDKYK